MTASLGAFGQFAFGQEAEDGTAYTMQVSAGAFVLSGGAITRSTAVLRTLNAGTAVFSLVGIPVALTEVGKNVLCAVGVGTFTLAGIPISIHKNNQYLTAAVGVFGLTGVGAMLVRPSPIALADGFSTQSATNSAWGISVASGVHLTDVLTRQNKLHGGVNDVMTVAQLVTSLSRLRVTHADAAAFAALVRSILPAYVSDSVSVAATMQTIRAIQIIERLTTHDVYAAMAKYHLSIHDTAVIIYGLFNHIGGAITDGINVHDAQTHMRHALVGLVDQMLLADLFGQKLIVTVTYADTAEITELSGFGLLFKSIMRCVVNDQIQIDVAYVEPSGSYTTWAVNTRNNAVTEYRNFMFNSFAKLGRGYIAANKNGIYELAGESDDGTPIPTQIGGGFFQPGGGRNAAFKAAYLGMAIKTGAPGVFLKLTTGDDQERVYKVNPMDRMTARVQFGKGLRSRYYAFDLITDGADYDLDSIEFIPLVAQRRFP